MTSTSTNLEWILIGSLIGAALLVGSCGWSRGVLSAIGGPQKQGLAQPVGPVNFNFSKSFASTITLLGALLTTILANKDLVPGTDPKLDAGSYAALSVFFGLLVVIAPVVYAALSKTVHAKVTLTEGRAVYTAVSATDQARNPDAQGDFQSQGYAGGFLLAALLTVWAAFGQLLTLLFFLTDTQQLQESVAFQVVLFVILIPTVLAVIVYVWRIVPAVLAFQADHSSHKAKLLEQLRQVGISDVEVQQAGPKAPLRLDTRQLGSPDLDQLPDDFAPLPSWQLL